MYQLRCKNRQNLEYIIYFHEPSSYFTLFILHIRLRYYKVIYLTSILQKLCCVLNLILRGDKKQFSLSINVWPRISKYTSIHNKKFNPIRHGVLDIGNELPGSVKCLKHGIGQWKFLCATLHPGLQK